MNSVSDTCRKRRFSGLVGLQSAVAAVALGWLLLAPPAQGQMLLVPLTGGADARLPGLALHGDTRLIAAGPLPGSLVVEGRRADLVGLFGNLTLVLAVPASGCTTGATA